MTNEQREAIEYLKESVLIYKNTIPKISQSIDTALSLIKQQQDKIENKDKQIDLMAEIFYKRFKAELLLEYGFESEEQLKQYFAGLVEKE